MLRLDPAHPPLWRDATTLQFGLEPVAIVDVSEPWQERLVRELERGIPPAGLEAVGSAVGAPDGAVGVFVRRLSRALATERPAPPSCVLMLTAERDDSALVGHLRDALEAAGFASAREPWSRTEATGDTPVILVAHHVVDPRSAALLLGRDIPHLPVVFSGTSVEIGPFVRPGLTPCLACVAAHRRDADDAWPQLASQLLGRRAPHVSAAAAWEGGLAAAHMLTDAARHPGRRIAHSLTVRAETGARTTRTHRPHVACRCRSLGGIATARVHEIPVTTRATAYARPA